MHLAENLSSDIPSQAKGFVQFSCQYPARFKLKSLKLKYAKSLPVN